MIFMLDVSITRVYLHSSCWSMFLAQVATHVRLLSKWVKVEKIEPNSKQVPIRIISQNLFCDRYKNCSLKGNHDVITTFSILPDAAWHGLQHKDIHQRSVCKSYLEAV